MNKRCDSDHVFFKKFEKITIQGAKPVEIVAELDCFTFP